MLQYSEFMMDSWNPEARVLVELVPGDKVYLCSFLPGPFFKKEQGQVFAVAQDGRIPIQVHCPAMCPLKYAKCPPWARPGVSLLPTCCCFCSARTIAENVTNYDIGKIFFFFNIIGFCFLLFIDSQGSVIYLYAF